IDARTGKERWRWDPEVNQTAVRPKICCGVVNRGIAIYQNNIIAPIIDGRLEALDAETGKPVWEARVAYPQDNYSITMAPRIAKGKVVIGVSGASSLRWRPRAAVFGAVRRRRRAVRLVVGNDTGGSSQAGRKSGIEKGGRVVVRRLVEARRRRHRMGGHGIRGRYEPGLRRHRQ